MSRELFAGPGLPVEAGKARLLGVEAFDLRDVSLAAAGRLAGYAVHDRSLAVFAASLPSARSPLPGRALCSPSLSFSLELPFNGVVLAVGPALAWEFRRWLLVLVVVET